MLAPARVVVPAAFHEGDVTYPVARAEAGDWEIGGGTRGSFAVVKRLVVGVITSGPEAGRRVRVVQTSVDDLVLALHERCANAAGSANIPVTFTLPSLSLEVPPTGVVASTTSVSHAGFSVVINGTTVTVPAGAVGTARFSGTLGASSASLLFAYLLRGSDCAIAPTRLTAHLGHRVAVTDGEWHGVASNGEPVLFGVVDGGRAIALPGTVPAGNDPTAFADELLSFRFGEGCTTSSSGGYTCATTNGSVAGWPTDACLRASTQNAFVTPGGTAMIGASPYEATSATASAAPIPTIDAKATIHFTGPSSATGTFVAPGCSTTFTARGP